MTERLFSYGSLRPGESNAHVLADMEGVWMPAVVRGKLYEEGWGADIGYPGIVLDDEGDEVQGQVFVSSHLGDRWAELDEFEGDEYKRVLTDITLDSGERVSAYVYVIRE